jgi:hypothetical protein
MLAIANQRMNVNVCNPEVGTLVVGTGIALGVHALGGAPPAFDLEPGTHRSRHWLSTRRGSGGETAGRAIEWGAWLEQTVHCVAHSSCL